MSLHLIQKFKSCRDFVIKVPILFLSVMVLFVSSGCLHVKKIQSFKGQTMGTYYVVRYVTDVRVDQKVLKTEVEDILKTINAQMSTYIEGSEIDNVSHKYFDQPIQISPWFAEVLSYSLQLSESTEGVFDPTVGPLVNLWGFGPKGERKVPESSQILEVKKRVGFEKVSVYQKDKNWFVKKSDPKVEVDLSATAKGFAVDKVAELLSQKGLNNHLVDIGGELRVKGQKGADQPWVVAIEKPSSSEAGVQLHFSLQDYSIATSGNYRNFFEQGGKKYSHTMDLKSGEPVVHNLISVTILEKECMKADGLATALMAMGPEKAWQYATQNNIAAYLIVAEKKSANQKTVDPEGVINVEIKSTPLFKELAQMND